MTNEMLHSNATNPLAGAPTRLLVAMEMSLNTWRLVMALEGGTRKRVKTVEAGNYLAVEQAVGEAKARFQLPAETPVVFCYEAGRDGFYPYRRLTAAGHEVWVIDSASIEVSRRRKQAKSDGIDGDKLAELMQRQARGEPKAVRIVRVPPPEVEDQRLLPREREILLQDVGRLRNQIEAILFAHGYREVPNTARARRLPALLIPCSRWLWPELYGVGVNPNTAPTSRRLRNCRQPKISLASTQAPIRPMPHSCIKDHTTATVPAPRASRTGWAKAFSTVRHCVSNSARRSISRPSRSRKCGGKSGRASTQVCRARAVFGTSR